MKNAHKFLGLFFLIACSSSEEIKSKDYEITKLELTIGTDTYPITFKESAIAEILLPLGSILPTSVLIKSLKTSDKASVNRSVGEVVRLENNSFSLTVIAEDVTFSKKFIVSFSVALSQETAISNLRFSIGADLYTASFTSPSTSTTVNINSALIPSSITFRSADLVTNATILNTVNSAISVNSNAFQVVVRAEDLTTTQAYTVSLNATSVALSREATMSSLRFSIGADLYTASFTSSSTSATVNINSALIPASVTFKSADLATNATISNTADSAISVNSDAFQVLVTAEDLTTTQTYAVSLNATQSQVTVTFDSNGGTSVNTASQITQGQTAASPITVPTRANYHFIGWYRDTLGTVLFPFSTPITANTRVYAKWIKIIDLAVDVSTSGIIAGLKSSFSATTNLGVFIPYVIDSKTVVGIANSAFAYNNNISTVTIENGPTAIGTRAFITSKVKNIKLPNTLRQIYQLTFHLATELTAITIPSSVTEIAALAFFGCSSLNLKMDSSTPPILAAPVGTDGVFDGLLSISVPSSAVSTYKATPNWSAYSSIITGY